ncbi:MAG: hypothetical protein HC897_07775 [Thermoanaerobaculia bacterium]|nr:hypothetical protein [Thermoanaerobaculia bacterium]
MVGWSDYAAAHDPDWGCRRRYLLVVTDGDETCTGPDACSGTAALFAQEGVKTFVVAFGVENTAGNRLNCMAASGGTGDPIYPQNKQELVDALTQIFGQIREETRTFASAAVPSVQAEVSDKIYLSNFTPLNGESFWDGHLDAYLKPLPLTEDNRPDENRECTSSVASSCHLWDAGDELVLQAPTRAEIDLGVLKLGSNENQRRVLYSQQRSTDRVPSSLRIFQPTTDALDQLDLWLGLDVAPVDPSDPDQLSAAAYRTSEVIKTVLSIKDAEVERADGTIEEIHYVLGDIFHSDPVLISNPSNFRLYSENLHSTRNADGSQVACDDPLRANPGYRCYAERQRYRRKMLAVGANDGQLHFFDAGYFVPGSPNPTGGRFNNGTGKELFSYLPRLALPVLTRQVEGTRQIYSLDSTLRIDDAFLDPIHDGTPDPDQREWRSVLIAGMREGGAIHGAGRLDESDGFVSGYFALDITQPDRLSTSTAGGVQSFLPSAQVVPSCLAADFASTGDQLNVAGCQTLAGEPRPFPSELWTFTDDWKIDGASYFFDEENTDADVALEGNGERDLGQTWSVPVITQVLVCTDDCDATSAGNDIERRYVAIVGGGLDPDNKANPQRGTWIYMIDVETGQALYKRQLIGAMPAPPAVVDDNLDGIADVVYAATTAGWVYKIDLRTPGALSTRTYAKELFVPTPLLNQSVTRVFDADWDPFPIFSTGGRPIYYAPTAFFIADLGTYGLAFGTGDREDLWDTNGQEGRYYFLVDAHFTAADVTSGVLPTFESDLVVISASSSPVSGSSNFVTNPPPGKRAGWVLTLEPDERILSQAFGLTGVLIFSTYQRRRSWSKAVAAMAAGATATALFALGPATAGSSWCCSPTPTRCSATRSKTASGSSRNSSPTPTSSRGRPRTHPARTCATART